MEGGQELGRNTGFSVQWSAGTVTMSLAAARRREPWPGEPDNLGVEWESRRFVRCY